MIHDLIIWPNASDYREKIIQDIRSEFRIIAIITLNWESSKVYDNFRVFYSKSWRFFSASKLQKAIRDKADHCGTGSFTLLVFEDATPFLSVAETTEGKRLVNLNVFNKKQYYRGMTGGGHLIHTSNDESETDRDLCLLLGRGTDDFIQTYSSGEEIEFHLSRDCSGVGGYDSLNSLFYTLNHTISYCVLRNFEIIPDLFFAQGHEDIYLLTKDYSHIVNLTLAKPISGSEYRVDNSIKIGGVDVPFDFRYVGDNYYDSVWEKHILERRRLERELFYIPASEDLYYSLLYHAYVQKHEIKSDYYPKLEGYAHNIGVVYNPDTTKSILQLDSYMNNRGYEYVTPRDKTVVYNQQNLSYSKYAMRYGRCIKHTEETGQNGYKYTSKVFEGSDSITKCGTSWLMENEAAFLEKIFGYDAFPHVRLKTKLDNDEISLTLSRLEGVGAAHFFRNLSNQRPRFLSSFIRQMIAIIRTLREQGIEHRDMAPSNVIVNNDSGIFKVGLIDFGWAANIGDENAKTPAHLGGRYADGNNHSDCYALAVFLMDYWPDLPHVRLIASRLFKAASGNTDALLKRVGFLANLPVGPYGRFRLLLRRHRRIPWAWHKLFK